jgi:hypothetical protein
MEKLSRNLDRAKKPKQVPAGLDNRSDVLHEARFLPGHICKHETLWIQARQTIGLTGLDPVSQYDFDSLGLAGKINSQIIAKLHNPGEKNFSLKMLAPAALDLARGLTEKEGGHPTKDFDSIQDIRMALTTLRVATRLIFPWNYAVEALDIFFTSIQYGTTEFGFRPPAPKLNFIVDFIDRILHLNSERWDDERGFLDYAEIRGRWHGELVEKFP